MATHVDRIMSDKPCEQNPLKPLCDKDITKGGGKKNPIRCVTTVRGDGPKNW